MNWEVRIIERGRHGFIEYIEGNRILECYWEFGGGNSVAIITLPTAWEWNTRCRWARGRRDEIQHLIAAETQRLRAPETIIEWDEARKCFYPKEKPAG